MPTYIVPSGEVHAGRLAYRRCAVQVGDTVTTVQHSAVIGFQSGTPILNGTVVIRIN
ncbi:MAG: hypothetical protein ABIU05_25695 [Nitrospirales bacterium]